jgi:hypothetical protein
MKDILEHFPLKKYGAIALLFLLPVFSLFYYFAYFPFLATNNTFEIQCDNTNGNSNNSLFVNSSTNGVITSIFSVPRYISNNSEINVSIRNISSASVENLKITLTPDILRFSRHRPSNITFEQISIELLVSEATDNKKIKLTAYGMQDGDPVIIRNIQIEFNGNIAKCKTNDLNNNEYELAIYNQLYAWILGTLESIPVVISVLLFLSTISCSIIEDENQDFPATSQMGRYYIARIFFRASIILATFFILLYWTTGSLVNIWSSSYMPYIGTLIIYIFVSQIAITNLSRLIKIKPKVKIIVNGSGKEKEIEVLENQSKFSLEKFLDELPKIKKR